MGFPFSDHVVRLKGTLAARHEIVAELERQLFGARGKAAARDGDRDALAEAFPQRLRDLEDQLATAHLLDGFEPAAADGYSRAFDPIELVFRACYHWDRDRWPGTTGRMAYTQSLFAAYIHRLLEYLSLRIWDEGAEAAADRLGQIQELLDALNAPSAAGPFVRDARWLIQTAQGPLTKHLQPYFLVAGKIATSFTGADRLEIHKAGAVLAGGHLRSQLRRLSWQTGWRFDDPRLVALTRSSNSMDLALLVGDLVPLLQAYDAARGSDPVTKNVIGSDPIVRLELADAILQGLSADPELLLIRLDLLGPSLVIEDLFVDRDHNPPRWTSLGEAQRAILRQYTELIGRLAEPLRQDARAFDPARAAYSPLGNVYGFCADLFSNMVLSTLRAPASRKLSLEDMFVSRERSDDKRGEARDWEALPRAAGERAPFECSEDWATLMFTRLASALDARAAQPLSADASGLAKARLYIAPDGVNAGVVSAQEHCLTSAAAGTAMSSARFVSDRTEGRFLASTHSGNAWFGVSKAILTLYLAQGRSALIQDLPLAVIGVLRLVAPELIADSPNT